jgi:hypothetical protein
LLALFSRGPSRPGRCTNTRNGPGRDVALSSGAAQRPLTLKSIWTRVLMAAVVGLVGAAVCAIASPDRGFPIAARILRRSAPVPLGQSVLLDIYTVEECALLGVSVMVGPVWGR